MDCTFIFRARAFSKKSIIASTCAWFARLRLPRKDGIFNAILGFQ